jgi:hypothetical protein
MKALSTMDRMKISHEQGTAHQQIHMIQRKVMEITKRIQLVQYKACMLFFEIKIQGAELEKVVITVEQCLEGPVNDTVILEFTQQEATMKQQVKAARAKIEAFKEKLHRPE